MKVKIPLEHPVDYLLSHKSLTTIGTSFESDSFLVIFASCSCGGVILPGVYSLIVMMFSHTFAHVIFLCASSWQVDCDNQQHCARWGLRQRQIAREDKGKHAFLQCVIHQCHLIWQKKHKLQDPNITAAPIITVRQIIYFSPLFYFFLLENFRIQILFPVLSVFLTFFSALSGVPTYFRDYGSCAHTLGVGDGGGGWIPK